MAPALQEEDAHQQHAANQLQPRAARDPAPARRRVRAETGEREIGGLTARAAAERVLVAQEEEEAAELREAAEHKVRVSQLPVHDRLHHCAPDGPQARAVCAPRVVHGARRAVRAAGRPDVSWHNARTRAHVVRGRRAARAHR